MEEIQLQKWTVRPSVGGVCVDGLRKGDASGMYWHSSSVVKRINGRLLETNSGSRYRLIGDLDAVYASQVSDYLCRLSSQFKRGFPKKWKSLIESATRAAEAKRDGDKYRQIMKTFQTPNYKTPARQNVANGKQLSQKLRNRSSRVNVNRHAKKIAVLSSQGIGKQTPTLRLHSVTRSMTKKLEQMKMKFMSDCEGSSLEDTLDDTILALRRRNLPFGQTLRKRKQPSDSGVASKKRKVESRSIGQSVIPDMFPTPAFQNNDVLLGSFSSQRTSLRKGKRIVSTHVEPDILTLEGLSMSPEEISEEPHKMVSSQGIIINAVTMPLNLDEEMEEDILHRSFLDCTQVCNSKRQHKPRSQTVQPKQCRAHVEQRKSRSKAPSKSRSVASRPKSPDRNLKLVTLCGGHNLRPRNVKKDPAPVATTEPRRKSARLSSKSRSGPRKHQLSENLSQFQNNQRMTGKKLQNNVVSGSRASPNAVTIKSSLGRGPAQRRSGRKQARSHSVDKIKLGSKNDTRNLAQHYSGSRKTPLEFEIRSVNTKQVVVGIRNDETPKSITQHMELTFSDDEQSKAERSVVIRLMKIDGREGQCLEEDCQNQMRNNVPLSLMTVQASQICAAETLHPKTTEEREESNDITALALKENAKNKIANLNKITGEGGTSKNDERTSVTCARDVNDANANSPRIIQSHDPHHITTLGSETMEESKSRNGAAVLELTEHGKAVNSGVGTSITRDEGSIVTQDNDTHLKSHDKLITETPHGCGKMRRNIRKSVGHNEMKMKSITNPMTTNMEAADTNVESPQRISVPVKNAKPKEKKTVAVKNKKDRKKKNKETVATVLNEIENGKRTPEVQRPQEQLEENMSSKTNILPLLSTNYVPLEVEPVDECCLIKCSEENVAVDSKVIPTKQTRRRKMAEIPTSAIIVKNQSQKSQLKNKEDQKMRASDKDDSLLANKNDQVTNVKLLGGRGTLKRQKELRKLIEKNMHCKDNNDFFSSTPFQNTRARRFIIPQFEDADDIFAEGDLSKALNYEKADVTPHALFHVMDYTLNKTPATTPNTSVTPAGIKRRRSEQEAYVHRVKKILRPGQRKGLLSRNILKKPQACYEPAAGVSRVPVPSLDKDLLEVGEVQQQDSEEEDYYFADD